MPSGDARRRRKANRRAAKQAKREAANKMLRDWLKRPKGK